MKDLIFDADFRSTCRILFLFVKTRKNLIFSLTNLPLAGLWSKIFGVFWGPRFISGFLINQLIHSWMHHYVLVTFWRENANFMRVWSGYNMWRRHTAVVQNLKVTLVCLLTTLCIPFIFFAHHDRCAGVVHTDVPHTLCALQCNLISCVSCNLLQ